MYKTTKTNLEFYKTQTLISQFKFWLSLKKYSSSTINNYLADVHKYLDYLLSRLPSPQKELKTEHVFSSLRLRAYLISISSHRHLLRYLASLSKFFQFAKDQRLIAFNPFFKVKRLVFTQSPSSDRLDPSFELALQQFQDHLQQQKLNSSTIKNHLKNLREYIIWSQNLGQT